MQTLSFELQDEIAALDLKKGQVHLWWLPLDVSDEFLAFSRSVLTQKQVEKVERLPTAEKKNRYIAGRGYLHRFLRAYLPAGADISLVYGKHGKPSLKDSALELSFNFTDTCGYGLFAFSKEGALGVDVENVERKGDFHRVAERRFSPVEQKEILLKESESESEYFIRCWTRKEAFGKAIGCGLNYTLREQEMCLSLNQATFGFKSNLTLSADADDTAELKDWVGQQFTIEGVDKQFVACLFSAGENHKELKLFTLRK